MKNKIGIILLSIICVMCSSHAFGKGILQQIYVDLKPINIVIDGEDKNPPSDMQPMLYNDRTYVPLRYVAESLGKDVDWDGTTRTVYIGEHKPLNNEIFESFTGPVSKNWEMKGTWTADGPNGYKGSYGSTANLINFFPDKQCDFTIEMEYYMPKYYYCFALFLGKDQNGNFSDELSINSDGACLGEQSCSINFEDRENIYYTFRLEIKKGQCFLFINNEYVHTFNLLSEIPALCITSRNGERIRNMTVTIND